jgi:hypothetical protein
MEEAPLTVRAKASPSRLSAPTGPDRLARSLRAILLGLTALVAVLWVVTAVVHAADAYGNDRVSGSWLVFGEQADQGRFYLPPFDGHTFGGTRWMPLPILVYAAAHRLGGHGYLPAKLAVYAVGLVLLWLLATCARRLGAPRHIAAGLVAIFLATTVGFDAATTIAGDALALVFALLALLLTAEDETLPSRSHVFLPALFSALAVLSKSSALWVVATIAIYLALGSTRRAGKYVAATAALVAAGVALAELGSSGRFLTNLRELSVAGYGGAAHLLVDAPLRLLTLAQQFDDAVWLLVPFAVGAVLVRASRRRLTVFDIALPIVVVVTIVVLADAGTYANHLVEPSAVVLVLVGSLWYQETAAGSRALLDLIVPGGLIVALAAGCLTTLKPIAHDTLHDLSGSHRYGPQVVAAAVSPNQTLLAEDPGIPYELARRPVVGDAFMVPRIAKRHPGAVASLAARIRAGGFDKVVLDVPISDTGHFAGGDFGSSLAAAIARAYRLDEVVGGRFVYTPRRTAP